MSTAPHAQQTPAQRPAFVQHKHYAGMKNHTDIDELDVEDEELNEDECRRLFESYLDENGCYILSPEQKARLDKSEQDIAAGLWISHEDVMKEIDAWLTAEILKA